MQTDTTAEKPKTRRKKKSDTPAAVADFLGVTPEAPVGSFTSGAAIPLPEIPTAVEVKPKFEWFRRHDAFGDIEVTQVERDLYLKATLNDKPLIWPILMPGEQTVCVRSLTPFDEEVCRRAVSLDEAETQWLQLTSLEARYQGYLVCLQVVQVNDIQVDYLKFNYDDLPSLETAAQEIRARYLKVYHKTSAPRYQLMLNACRIFSVKRSICDSAMGNANFWKTADIG